MATTPERQESEDGMVGSSEEGGGKGGGRNAGGEEEAAVAGWDGERGKGEDTGVFRVGLLYHEIRRFWCLLAGEMEERKGGGVCVCEVMISVAWIFRLDRRERGRDSIDYTAMIIIRWPSKTHIDDALAGIFIAGRLQTRKLIRGIVAVNTLPKTYCTCLKL